MRSMKKALGIVILLVVLAVVLFIAFTAKIPYYIRGQGVVMPLQEWSLLRGSGSSLVHIFENHLEGVVTEYGVSEVQRGDVVRYHFNDALLKNGYVQKGDTLALLYTSDIHLKIIELQGELSYQQSLLSVFMAGEKPEEIRVAENRIELARQELETQQAVTNRIIRLYEEGVVSQLEYELSANDLKVKEYALEIAESLYNTLSSGRKTEDLDAIRSRITALNNHIEQIKTHIDAFHLIAPMSGSVIRERNPVVENTTEVILRIADFSSYVIIMPVDYSEELYLIPGQHASIRIPTGNGIYPGELVTIDKTIRLINNKPKVFVTILLTDGPEANLYRNMMVQASIDSGETSVWSYLGRVFKSVYQN